jgi:hypothetical protein
MLASLRREEILAVATLYRHSQSDPRVKAAGAALKAAKTELIPKVFQDEEEFLAALGAATRTGLVTYISGFDRVYMVSPLMDRL